MRASLTIPVKTTLPRQNKRSLAVRAAQGSNNNSTKSERQSWDFKRFVKTVLYFNPPPTPGEVVRSVVTLPFKVLTFPLKVLGGSTTQKQQASNLNTNLITTVPLQTSPSQAASMSSAVADSSMGIALVPYDATNDIAKRVIARLLQQGRHVRAIVERSDLSSALSSLPAAPGARLEMVPQQQSTDTDVLTGVGQLIWPTSGTSTTPATASSKPIVFKTLLASLVSAGALPKPSGQAIYTPDGLSPAKEWGPVDDVVMGGVSLSAFSVVQGAAEDGISPAGVFGGNVTSANNGGFASTRTRNLTPPLNLAAYDGIELRVRGDGQRYKCVIKTDQSWDGVGYTASFDTSISGWQTIQIPFSSLVPVFRAKTQYDAAPFDPSRVTSIQLMLSKFEYDGRLNPTFREGKFEFPVERIQAYVGRDGEEGVPRVILVKSDGGSVEEEEKIVKESGVAYVVKSVSDF